MSVSPKKSDTSKSKEKKDKKQEKAPKLPKDNDNKDTKSKKSKDPDRASNKGSTIQMPKPPQPQHPSSKPHLLPPPTEQTFHICRYHSEAAYSFCQTCQQLCCSQCSTFGPHQSQIHKIVAVEECYRNRYTYLKELIYKDLLKKRDVLSQRILQLNEVMEELKYNKQVIEREIRMEFDEVLERLKVGYGGKLAVLYNAMAELQRQMENLNAVGKEFFELTNLSSNESAETNPKGLIPFLLRSRHLQEEAENLIAFPIHETVNIYPYDLPREVNHKKQLLQKARHPDPVKDFKHQVIYSLVKQNQQTGSTLESQFHQEAHLQKLEWLKITEQLKSQLAKFDRICHFCGVPLSKGSVNSECSRNSSRSESQGYATAPASEYVNTGFHYFSAVP